MPNKLHIPQCTEEMITEYNLNGAKFQRILDCAMTVQHDYSLPSITLLAEYVADEMSHWEWLDDIQHPLWDIALYAFEYYKAD